MPAFCDNPDIGSHMDDLDVDLETCANEARGRSRPRKHDDTNDAYTKNEDSCMGRT